MQESTADNPSTSKSCQTINPLHLAKRFTLRVGHKDLRLRLFNVNTGLLVRGNSANKRGFSAPEDVEGVIFRCITCNEVFSTAIELRDHGKTHTSRRLYVCSECGKRFAFRETLAKHTETHVGKPKSTITLEGRSLSGSMTQIAENEAVSTKLFCVACNCSFASVDELDRHKVDTWFPFGTVLKEFRMSAPTTPYSRRLNLSKCVRTAASVSSTGGIW